MQEIISNGEIVVRLFLSVIFAFAIGLEREFKHQPAGLRTHILIGLGSCMLMILSILVPEVYNSNINDPGRIAAQVVSGVGFLWAWAIIKTGLNTRGLTTAANIWATAAIGLCVWAGLLMLALISTLLILLNLVLITRFKAKYIIPSRFCTIDIHFAAKKADTKKIYEAIKLLPLKVISKHIKEDWRNVQLKIISEIKKNEDIFAIKDNIKWLADIEKISVSESVKV
jgi:putative Mg2+ transporter-C (MgtC) family protein